MFTITRLTQLRGSFELCGYNEQQVQNQADATGSSKYVKLSLTRRWLLKPYHILFTKIEMTVACMIVANLVAELALYNVHLYQEIPVHS